MFQKVLIFSCLIAAFFVVSCNKESLPIEITVIHAYPDSVFPGDTVELAGGAVSPQADYINFRWYYLDQVLPQPLWIAPKVLGDHYIILTASDQTSNDTDSIRIYVKDTTGVFIDSRDNREYKWVKIGQQIWMAENLAYLPSVTVGTKNSESDPLVYVSGYNGENVQQAMLTETFNTFGAYYNWQAAIISCPNGWHITTVEEWVELREYIRENRHQYIPDGTDFGNSIASRNGWDFHNTPGSIGNNPDINNSTGLTVLPGGTISTTDGEGYGIGQSASYWTSSLEGPNAYRISLKYYNKTAKGSDYALSGISSVRCIKDGQ